MLPSLDALQPLTDEATSVASTVAKAAANAAVPSFLTGGLTNYVFIGLGFLLIAAGIFSFDKTRELVVDAAKTGAKTAAAAG